MAYARTAPRWDPSPSRDWTEPSSGFWFLNLCCAMREVRRGSAGARPQRRAASARPLRSEAEPGLALRGVGNGRAGPNPGPSPGSRTRDSARKDRAQSRPKVFRVSGSGHTVEGPFWRAKSARESSGGPGIFAFVSACKIGSSKPPSSIWPLPETPSTGVRPGSVGFPLTDEPSERRFACLLLATSIPAFAFPTGSSRCPLVLHGLCTHGASLGPLTVSGLDGAILRFLVLESLLCDAGGNYVARAPSAEPRAQGPRAREAQARALRCGGWGTGEQGQKSGLLLTARHPPPYTPVQLGIGSRGQTFHGRFEGMVGGGAPLVSFHVRPQYSDPESRRHAAF